jgi:hypothetical protein
MDLRSFATANPIPEADTIVMLTDLITVPPQSPDTTLTLEEYHLALMTVRHIALDALYLAAENSKEVEEMTLSYRETKRELENVVQLNDFDNAEKEKRTTRSDHILARDNEALRTQIKCLEAEVLRLHSNSGPKDTTFGYHTIEVHLLGLTNAVRTFCEWVREDFWKQFERVLVDIIPGWRHTLDIAVDLSVEEMLERSQQLMGIALEQMATLPEVFHRERDRKVAEERLLEVLLFDTQQLHSVSDDKLAAMRRCVIDELEVHQEGRWIEELLRTLPRPTEFVCAHKAIAAERMHTRMTRWVEDTRMKARRRLDKLKTLKSKELGWLAGVVALLLVCALIKELTRKHGRRKFCQST